jgi:hypothetical protein
MSFPVPGCRFPVPAVVCCLPGPRSQVPGPAVTMLALAPRRALGAAGQADSSALAVDSPGPLGRGGDAAIPPSFSCVCLGGRLRRGVRPVPPRARRSPRRRGRKGGIRWPGAATSAWKAEATPRFRGAKAHEMGLRSRGQRRPTGSPIVGRGSRHVKDTRSPRHGESSTIRSPRRVFDNPKSAMPFLVPGCRFPVPAVPLFVKSFTT